MNSTVTSPSAPNQPVPNSIIAASAAGAPDRSRAVPAGISVATPTSATAAPATTSSGERAASSTATPAGISSVRPTGRCAGSTGAVRAAPATRNRPASTIGTGASSAQRQPTACSSASVPGGPTNAGRIHIADDAATTRARTRSSSSRMSALTPKTASSPLASPPTNRPPA